MIKLIIKNMVSKQVGGKIQDIKYFLHSKGLGFRECVVIAKV
jgi:hypothetical protein